MIWDLCSLIIEVVGLEHLSLSCYLSEDPIFFVGDGVLNYTWFYEIVHCLEYYSFVDCDEAKYIIQHLIWYNCVMVNVYASESTGVGLFFH